MSGLLVMILLPVLGFLFSGIFGNRIPKTLTGWISSLTILGSFILGIQYFNEISVTTQSEIVYIYNFLHVGDFQVNFGLTIDRLSAAMVLVVTGIGFLIHVYSISYMHEDAGFYKFFAYLNLFIFNMLVLVMGSNFLMLFFGWEGVGLCSYLLIGFWYENATYGKAARKAFIMNRIGDLGLLLGIFLIYWNFHSLEYSIVFKKFETSFLKPEIATAIGILLFIGAIGKSAQIPLFTWLPDAMAGPTPVSALIHAATMVTAGVYLVVRCQIWYIMSPVAQSFILYVGLTTSILAALIGLKQNDIKKVLAYSTVSQLGLMFMALGVGAYTAAIFHVITHAFFKALLFLGSGSVIHAMGGEQDIRKMGGLKSRIPITYGTFLIGTLAITGFPFLSGFFSKDEILVSIFIHHKIIWGLGLVSAAITAFYMFRMFFVTFHGTFRGTALQASHMHESPWQMTLPLIILAILSITGGWLNLPAYMGEGVSAKLHHWLDPISLSNLEQSSNKVGHVVEYLLAGLAVLVFIIGYLAMRNKYITKKIVPESDDALVGIGKTLASKFYIDELYDKTFVSGIEKSSHVLKTVDEKGIDGAVNGVGKTTSWIASHLRKLQNGNIEYYLLFMVLGLVLLLTFNIFS